MLGHQPLTPTAAPKNVIVVGAGMAGLTGAYELVQAGHHVRILEARNRPGGRVWTLRTPFPEGLFAEVGATFLPDNHPLPLHYAAAFGLQLVALPTTGVRPRYRVGGVSIDDSGLGPAAVLSRTIGAIIERHGGWPLPTGSAGIWEALDQISLAELLRREGLSEEQRAMVGLTTLGNLGEGIETISALAAIRQLALLQGRNRSFVIAGGNDRLARAFVDRLGTRVRFGWEVLGLSQDATAVVVRGRGPNGEGEAQADHVILAMPTRVLTRLVVWPAWSTVRATALRQQRWTSVTRVFLTVERRFWDPAHPVLLAASDQPTVRWVVGPAAAGPRDILTAYVMGAAARALALMSPGEQAAWARAEAARIFPEWTEAASAAAVSHCWDQDPFAGGGYPWPAPGDDRLPEILAAPEGRIHFAGEHTTHHYGWIQGAMESGLRAAREVHEAMISPSAPRGEGENRRTHTPT